MWRYLAKYLDIFGKVSGHTSKPHSVTKMAKPNSSIITTGIPKSTVRLSRRICLASFFTNDVNCFMSDCLLF